MHASVVMPILESDEVTTEAKQRIADLVVRQGKMIGGNFSEPGHTSLIGERPLSVRAHPVSGGYRITGRKMFASMIEAADYVLVLVYPETATSPTAGMLALIPPDAEGRRVIANWDTLGMRATRSDSLILEDCFGPGRIGDLSIRRYSAVSQHRRELVLGFLHGGLPRSGGRGV